VDTQEEESACDGRDAFANGECRDDPNDGKRRAENSRSFNQWFFASSAVEGFLVSVMVFLPDMVINSK